MAFFFTTQELIHSDYAEKHNMDNTPETFVIRENLEYLKSVLDLVRAHVDSPIIVNSGYRCPCLNKAVGGVENSLHLQGRAADIRFVGPALMNKAYSFLNRNRKQLDIAELIRYDNFLHVGVNESPTVVLQ